MIRSGSPGHNNFFYFVWDSSVDYCLLSAGIKKMNGRVLGKNCDRQATPTRVLFVSLYSMQHMFNLIGEERGVFCCSPPDKFPDANLSGSEGV